MQLRHVLEIDLPSVDDATEQALAARRAPADRAFELLLELRELAEIADPDDREYIAWRMGKVLNDVRYLVERASSKPERGTAAPSAPAGDPQTSSQLRRAA